MTENMKPSNLCDVTLPTGWEFARFRKLFSFGKGLSITKEDLVDEGVPVISYGQVHSKANTGTAIHESLIRFVPESYLKTDKQALTQEGNFIFADTSEDLSGVGNCAFVNTTETLFAGYHSIIARPKDTNMYPKYFAYQFLTDIWRDQIRAKVMGVKVFSISQKLLRDTTVFIPPIQEQKAIAKLLDTKCSKIDSVITDIEKQIETLQKYNKSLITEAVTKGLDRSVPMKDCGVDWVGRIPAHWSVKRLKYVMDNFDSQRKPIEAQNRSQDGDILYDYYGASGVIDKIDDYIFDETALLIGEDGANLVLRHLPLIYIANGKYWVNNHAHILRPKAESDLYYMAHQMEIIDYSLFITGSAQPKLSQENLNNVMLVVPPLEEQLKIAAFLNEKVTVIDEIIGNKQKQLDAMRQHKKSLIYEYVTGKKRVTEVN